jgi:hypothetical protein
MRVPSIDITEKLMSRIAAGQDAPLQLRLTCNHFLPFSHCWKIKPIKLFETHQNMSPTIWAKGCQ